MVSEGFQVARLIPVSGITSNVEAEMRATSALLSVLSIVRDLSVALLTPLGASSARRAAVEAFIETTFKLDSKVVRPDGLIQVTYGASVWKALVEVKTGDNVLEAEQVSNYVAVAREQGIDAVLTISNQIAVGGQHPCEDVKMRANSKVRLAHFSWTEILAHAVRTKVHRGVTDPEQAWILGELIRYLEDKRSGAMAFEDMGGDWVAVRDAAREGTLRKADPGVREIVGRWDQLLQFAALRLGEQTGADVQHVVARAQSDPKIRCAYLTDTLVGSGTLEGVVRVPGAASDIALAADLRARRVSASADITAPTDRGNKARITWLVKQLGADTPSGLTIEAWGRNARQPVAATLVQAREDRDVLLDPSREIARFRLVQRCEMGANRKDGGRSPGFIQSAVGLLNGFYSETLRQVVPPPARAPQVRKGGQPTDLVKDPIGDAAELDEAMGAARANVAEETGDATETAPRLAAADVVAKHEGDGGDLDDSDGKTQTAPGEAEMISVLGSEPPVGDSR